LPTHVFEEPRKQILTVAFDGGLEEVDSKSAEAVLQITEASRADHLTSTSLTSKAEVYLRIRESHPKPGVVEVR
jgi:hypothetical protein